MFQGHQSSGSCKEGIKGIHYLNKKRYDSELPYQRPDLIEVMEIEINLTTN